MSGDHRKTKKQLVKELTELRARLARAEAAHPSSFFTSLMDSMPHAVFCKDMEGRFIYVNNSFCKTENLTPLDILGKTDFDIHPLEAARKYRDDDRRVINSGEVVVLVEEHAPLNAPSSFTQVVKAPVFDLDGEITSIIGVFWDITDLKRTEQALSESEANYRQLVEMQNDLVVKVDAKGCILFASPSFCRLFDIPGDDVLGHPYVRMIHEEDRNACISEFAQLRHPPHTGYSEHRVRSPSGLRWLAWSNKAVLDGQGEVKTIFGVGRDITQRKQAEIRLEEKVRELDLLYKLSARASASLSPDEVLDIVFFELVQEFSPRQAMLHMERDGRIHLVGHHADPSAEDSPPLPMDDHQRGSAIRSLLKGGSRAAVFLDRDHPLLRESGLDTESIGGSLAVFPLTFSGSMVGTLAMALDTAAEDEGMELTLNSLANIASSALHNAGLHQRLTRSVEELDEARLTLSRILEAMPFGVLLVDEAKTIRMANRTALDTLGYSHARELVGKTCHGVMCPSLKGKCPILDHGQEMDREERFMIRADGSHLPILKSVIRIDYLDQPVLLEAFVDITEIKKAREAQERMREDLERQVGARTRELMAANKRLEQLDQLKSSFVSAVSHELRTPMTSILGFAKLISKDFSNHFKQSGDEDGSQDKFGTRILQNLDIIVSEGERLTRLINDVLDLNRIESGRAIWNDRLINPADVLSTAISSAEVQLMSKPEVTLATEISPELPEITIDPDHLAQVVTNLLSNAVKFTDSGAVTLKASAVDGLKLRIQVEDTGPGIPEQEHERIFDRFYQVAMESGGSAKPKGTGLGLTICKLIVEHYRGDIRVDSEPGRGATFTVDLPLVTPPSG